MDYTAIKLANNYANITTVLYNVQGQAFFATVDLQSQLFGLSAPVSGHKRFSKNFLFVSSSARFSDVFYGTYT